MSALAGSSIFLAAFLLFALEPLIAKRVLPWFGGSAAVWSVCLVFYQVALLAGYLYARLLTRYLRHVTQAAVHISLLAASLLFLPIGPSARWKQMFSPQAEPAWLELELLTATIGLPFALLAATSPLLQDWLSSSGESRPYRFFAWSNFASLAALLAYPLLIEPFSDARQQSVVWSAGFAVFVLLCATFTWRIRGLETVPLQATGELASATRKVCWFALGACGSMLLLSVTNQIDENVAAVPLLWVLPLAIYLVSFVVTFGGEMFYRRALWMRLLAFSLAMVAYAAYDITAVLPVQISVPVYLAGLFVTCVFCQGELYRLRPANQRLTGFYLTIAAGGASGSVFVGLIAPHVFGGIYELPLSLTLTAALALMLTWKTGGWGARLLWAGVTACMAAVFVVTWQAYGENTIALKRSFYGSLRVVDLDATRTLFHGTIQHGSEHLAKSRRLQATSYYGPDSGIGILLREWLPRPMRVGIVGLGAGTLAIYAEPGDTFRFYEINPQIIDLAEHYFYFLKASPARTEIVAGDARLKLERESIAAYDVLVLDAFSGDAIPVHLLTSQAMQLYRRRLQPHGVIAFHVSNNYLDLAPVVAQLASAAGYQCLVVKSRADKDSLELASEWVLVTNNAQVLGNDALQLHAVTLTARPKLRLWTDEFNSLLPILKTPEVH